MHAIAIDYQTVLYLFEYSIVYLCFSCQLSTICLFNSTYINKVFFKKMFYMFLGVIIGIWLDQTFTIPSVQEYIEIGVAKLKEKDAK